MKDDRRLWKSASCLVYKRCSKDTQDVSISDQEESIKTAMRQLGITKTAAVFEDDGKRGHDESRPGLLAILSHVRKNPHPVRSNSDFTPILIYDIARFGRFDDPKKIFSYFVEVERYGYEFYSVSERIRSRGNISDFVQAIVKSEQAYDYSVSLSRYAMRTGCSLAQKGWWPGGTPPYAYDRMTYGPNGKPKYRYVTMPDKSVEKQTPDGKVVETLAPIVDKGRIRSAYSDKIKTDKVKLIPGDRERVRVVQTIFEKFVEEGWGLRRVSAYLNARGIPPPRGKAWLHTSIRGILLNPAYRGALVYGRRSDGKHHWLTIAQENGQYSTQIERKDVPGRMFIHRTEKECIVIPDCHESIISPELWFKVQRRLVNQRHGPPRSGLGVKSSYLLTGDGLMRCVRCGYRFQGDTERRTRGRRYIDGGYHMGGTSVCSSYILPADDLENWVIDEIQSSILDGRTNLFEDEGDLVESIEQALAAGRAKVPSKDEEVRKLERRIAERKSKVDMLVSSISPENMSLLDTHLTRLRDEISSMENELRALKVANRAQNIVTRDLKALAREAATYLVDLRKVLEKGTPEQKKRFVRDFVADVVVDGEKREVQVGFYDYGSVKGKKGTLKTLQALAERRASEEVPLWLVPPTGFEPVSRA